MTAIGLSRESDKTMTEYASKTRRNAPPIASGLKTSAPIVRHVTASGGQTLDAKTQQTMGARFGHDFSQVRIHSNARAFECAQAVGANAYAVGNDIVFGAGHFQPHSRDGERLLAHELTHVVQQSRFGMGSEERPSRREDASEQEAEAVASQVLSGRNVRVQALPQATLARDDDALNSSVQQRLSDQWKLKLDDQGAGMEYNQGPFTGRFGAASPDNPGVSGSLGLGSSLAPFPFYHPDPKDDPFHPTLPPLSGPGPAGDSTGPSMPWGLRGDGFVGSDGWGLGASAGFRF